MSGRAPTKAERAVQEDLVRLESYRTQLSAMVQQLQFLASSRNEHRRAREALEGLDRPNASADLLVALGADSFVRGTATTDGKVLLGVGSGVVVELNRPTASEMLAQRGERLEQGSRDLESQAAQLEDRIEQLSRRIDAMTRGESPEGDGQSSDVGGN